MSMFINATLLSLLVLVSIPLTSTPTAYSTSTTTVAASDTSLLPPGKHIGVNFSIGSGLLELSHIGLGLEISNFELRASYGYGFAERVTSLSLDGHYHLAVPQKYSHRRKFYVGTGISYLVAAENISYDDAGFALRGYLGCEFNFGRHVGMQFEVGVSLNSPLPIEHVASEGISPTAAVRIFIH